MERVRGEGVKGEEEQEELLLSPPQGVGLGDYRMGTERRGEERRICEMEKKKGKRN